MPEAIYRQASGLVDYTAGSDLSAGWVFQLADKRAAILAADVKSGKKVGAYTQGIVDIAAASGTTFSAGDEVYWDESAGACIARSSADLTADFFLGVAVVAKVSGELFVAVDLNAGRKTTGGTVTLDGSNPTPIVTGLAEVIAFSCNEVKATSPGDDPIGFSHTVSGGTVSLYAWKTDGSDPTWVASTNNSATISWIAVGH